MFPSTHNGYSSASGSNQRQSTSSKLNATQQKSGSQPLFQKIEQELHDARRVQSHGQEDDLRQALGMVIDRVGELSSMLNEVYKSQADLEVQLNVAKSNLQLVMSNNEMLEEEIKRNSAEGVGWRRFSSEERTGTASSSLDLQRQTSGSRSSSASNSPVQPAAATATVTATDPADVPMPPTPVQESTGGRLLSRFRFGGGSQSRPASRPETPVNNVSSYHSNSTSMPQLPSSTNVVGSSTPSQVSSPILTDLQAELEKERNAHQMAVKDKTALEEELETLSQALFEEANKMVATERMKAADAEEELKEVKLEKEALKSALRLLEEELQVARPPMQYDVDRASSVSPPLSTSASDVAIKSPPESSDEESYDVIGNETLRTDAQEPGSDTASLRISLSTEEVTKALSPSSTTSEDKAPSSSSGPAVSSEEEVANSLQTPDSEDTQTIVPTPSPPASASLTSANVVPEEPSPWADSKSSSNTSASSPAVPTTSYTTAALHALR